MEKQFAVFVVRWLLNSFGLWIAVRLLGTGDIIHNSEVGIYLSAGLVFSILNSILRPVLVIISLPAILLTLGLFMLIVNGFMVWLALQLVPGLHLTFLSSIFAGMLLSLINYIVSSAQELRRLNNKKGS